MRRSLVWLVMVLLCVSPLAALSEEGVQVIYLPRGAWAHANGGEWRFVISEDVRLTEGQLQVAEAAGIVVEDGLLPEGASLTAPQTALLYPGAEDYFALPELETASKEVSSDAALPQLSMFSLDGKWYYGEDDVLYYTDRAGTFVMTVDQVFRALNGGPSANEKIVYLTIDDGPSSYTMEMLAVLDKLNVKATFFVMGANVKARPLFLRAIYDQGHVIANHSYSHDASVLTLSQESCLNDFRRCEEAVNEALGFTLPMPLLRVPYGSDTLSAPYKEMLQKSGYLWIDWNALNGDTEGAITTDTQAVERAMSTASRYKGPIVLLVHDGKKRTIRTLPEIVRLFREQGYEFRVLEPDMPKLAGVRMGLPIR